MYLSPDSSNQFSPSILQRGQMRVSFIIYSWCHSIESIVTNTTYPYSSHFCLAPGQECYPVMLCQSPISD